MFGLPSSTEIRKPVHKKLLYQKFPDELSGEKKERFDADISRIIIINEIMVINFMSQDSTINEGIKCLPTDVFAEVEEKLYKKYDNLRNTNNMFTANAKPVLRFKKLYENGIKDGDKIQLFKLE